MPKEILVHRDYDSSKPPVAKLVFLDESSIGEDDVIGFGVRIGRDENEPHEIVSAGIFESSKIDTRPMQEKIDEYQKTNGA